MITKESIENLKSHLDIVDVISQFLELKKAGANFKACCPFHGEETPSFVVSPAKQIFHCFGCSIGGDSIKFVMEYEKLNYPETLEKLASMYNVPLEYDNNFKKQDRKVIESINNFYQKSLVSNNIALDYLQQRGVSDFSIEKFEIGYASSSNVTIDYLNKNYLNLNDAKDFGIIDNGQNGLYARFIERITFPIYTITGNIVGFGGRTISGHNAKYINSPQTKLFNKSRLLYGYHLAKEHIYKTNTIIVTEGYLDVIMLHQSGFSNAVATLGTALTAEHLPLLKRGEPEVIIAYDGDKAGLNAAYKASLLLSHSSFQGGVVIFEDGYDPADMVKNNKINILQKKLSKPTHFIPYVIDYIISKYNIENPQDKQQALDESNNYLKTLSPILQEEYSTLIARKLNINPKIIQTKVSNNTHQPSSNVTLNSFDIAELNIIKTALSNNELLYFLKEKLDTNIFKIHKSELNILFYSEDKTVLNGILLNEHLKIYSKEELELQINLLSIPYYKYLLQQLNYDNSLDFITKSKKVRELKTKINNLKRTNIV
ncbi:MAG: DNA primase [Campylobacterota bacterium]|nr:DNA primase [Campylobacterota bacterium]